MPGAFKITIAMLFFLAAFLCLPDFYLPPLTFSKEPGMTSHHSPAQPAPAAPGNDKPASAPAPEENKNNRPVTVEPAAPGDETGATSPEPVEAAPPLNHAPAPQQPGNPVQLIKRVENVSSKVALTFDDGPFEDMTPQYLAVLQQYNARATFFMVGQRVGIYPGLAQQVVDQGSEIGSHSWRHAYLDQLEPGAVAADLRDTAQQIHNLLGQEVTLLRPPYGRHSESVLTKARELNQKVVLWDVDPRDWEEPPPAVIASRVLDKIKPGSIVVLHEGKKNTLLALPLILEKLQERGLQAMTVSELLAGSEAPPPPGGDGNAPTPID